MVIEVPERAKWAASRGLLGVILRYDRGPHMYCEKVQGFCTPDIRSGHYTGIGHHIPEIWDFYSGEVTGSSFDFGNEHRHSRAQDGELSG